MARPLKDGLERDARASFRLPSTYVQRLKRLARMQGEKTTVNDMIVLACEALFVQSGMKVRRKEAI